MSELLHLSTAEQHGLLLKKGAALGLTAAEVISLIVKYGPFIAELLIKLLESRRKLGVAANAPLSATLAEGLLKRLFVEFITSHQADVLKWVEEGEKAIYDGLVSLLASKSPILADVLTKYKETILAVDDAATAKLLDQLISALKGETKPDDGPPPVVPPFIPPIFRVEDNVEDAVVEPVAKTDKKKK